MDNISNPQPWQGWAVVELIGRSLVAGYVSTQDIAGTAFVRVSVPPITYDPASAVSSWESTGFDKFYNPAAIFAIVPTTEAVAREAAERIAARPVKPWVVPVSPRAATVDSPAEYRTVSEKSFAAAQHFTESEKSPAIDEYQVSNISHFAYENEPEF